MRVVAVMGHHISPWPIMYAINISRELEQGTQVVLLSLVYSSRILGRLRGIGGLRGNGRPT